MNSSFNSKQVKKKWENLVQAYKKLKSPDTGVSSEDGCSLPTTWVFYEEMDKIFAAKHIINPPVLISSLKPQNKNHDRNVDSAGPSSAIIQESNQRNRPQTSRLTTDQRRPITDIENPRLTNYQRGTPTAVEYFGPEDNLDFLSPPSKKRRVTVKDEMLDYLKSRDKKLIKQNETMIFLMKQSLISEGVDINQARVSDDSDDQSDDN